MQVLRSFLILLLFTTTTVFSQEVDQFNDHLPYNNCISIAIAPNNVYCATPYSLFVYNQSDNSVERFTKIQGLSDIDISKIAWHDASKTLVVAYNNTNIDLIKDGEVINISDIKRKPILGNKVINDIFIKDNFAYLSCGFGIVVLDIDREEIHDTYKIGPDGSQINVTDFTYHQNDNRFYATTEAGIYFADADSPNLAHFAYWQRDDEINEPLAFYSKIESFNDYVIVNKHSSDYGRDTLFSYDGQHWDYLTEDATVNAENIRKCGNELVISYTYGLKKFDSSLQESYKLFTYGDHIGVMPRDAYYYDDMFVIADGKNGLVLSSGNWNAEFIHPSGPLSPDVFQMTSYQDQVWVASGGYQSNWSASNVKSGIYGYVNGQWNTYNNKNTPALDSIPDITCVAVEPGGQNKVYAGSWRDGVLEFTDGEITNIFSKENSSLEGNVAAARLVQVSGLQFDDDMNLWVVNTGADNVLSVKKNNGEWKSFNLGSQSSGAFLKNMIIDDNNQKWILMRNHRILVFSDNNTLDQPNDDQYKILTATSGNGNIPGSDAVYSIAKDQDGEIWIGTDEGVGVIYNAEEIFSNVAINAQKPLVEVDGYVQYLLSSEQVTAIAIDGANRKWIGTQRAGVFLMSEDGTKQIHHFTTENSPLFSDDIYDITINDDGFVFIGTSKGIISYRSNATPPSKTNKNLKIYPNPVVQGYEGPIAISGLVRDASVKITDISGNLIFSTIAEGGQAVWNGRNFDGRKASTGVYMVFVSDEEGSETAVGKIMIIKN